MLFSFRGGTRQPDNNVIEKFLLFCIDSKGREIPLSRAIQYGLVVSVMTDRVYDKEAVGNIIGLKVICHYFSQSLGRRNLEVYIKAEYKKNAPIIEIRSFSRHEQFYFIGLGRIVKPKALGVRARNTASAAIPKTILESMIKVTYPRVGVRRIRTN